MVIVPVWLMVWTGLTVGGCYVVLAIALGLLMALCRSTRPLVKRWLRSGKLKLVTLAGLLLVVVFAVGALIVHSRMQIDSMIEWSRECTHITIAYYPNVYESALPFTVSDANQWRTAFPMPDKVRVARNPAFRELTAFLENAPFEKYAPFTSVSTFVYVVVAFFDDNRKIGSFVLVGGSVLGVSRFGVYDVEPDDGLLDALLVLSPDTRAATLHGKCASRLG